jgi:arylformamidase
MKRPWRDATHPLRNGMACWPGDPAFEHRLAASMATGDACNLSVLSLCAHTGTHMDAPCHYIADGETIDRMPLDAGIGPCRVVALDVADQITAADLLPLRLRAGERILFKTRNSQRNAELQNFDRDFISLRTDAAALLAQRQVRLVGIDYLSIGGYEKDGDETHHHLLSAGIWIVEGLDLRDFEPGRYDMICLPLKIAGADGAPCRVLLR